MMIIFKAIFSINTSFLSLLFFSLFLVRLNVKKKFFQKDAEKLQRIHNFFIIIRKWIHRRWEREVHAENSFQRVCGWWKQTLSGMEMDFWALSWNQ